MDKSNINFILDNYAGTRRDRALKLESGLLKRGDQEFNQYIKNELFRSRRIIIKNFMQIERISEYKKGHLSNLKCYQRIGDIVNAAETQLHISNLDIIKNETIESIATLGKLFADILRSDVLTEHEICQILNINAKTWDRCKTRYMRMRQDEWKAEANNYLNYSIIAVTGPEYRERRGRMKYIFDCPDYEMPIYWAMHIYMIEAMKENKEFQKATREKLKEFWPEIKTYKVAKDAEGNVIKMVEEN